MASYPTSVFAPSAKSAGQTIDASHINDLQNEAIAVEDALLNGIAHAVTISTGGLTVSTGSVNIGGPSSVATLQVNGRSTLAGNMVLSSALSVGGLSTFTGAVTCSSNLTVGGDLTVTGTFNPARPACARVTQSAQTNIPDSAETGLNWNGQTFLTGAIHSTSANSSRITCGSTGLWDVGAVVPWSSGITAFRESRIKVNDGTVIANARTGQFNDDASPSPVHIMHTIWAATSSADYFTVTVTQNSGSTKSIIVTGAMVPTFWAVKRSI